MPAHSGEEPKKKSKIGLLAALIAVGVACLLIGISWWEHFSVEPKPPSDPNANFELLPTTSNLSLAVDLPIEAIKKILEEQVPNPIKFAETNDWHVYGDLPRQPISVHVDAKTKKINLTTSVAGKVQAEKNFVGKFSVGINVKGNLNASFSPVIAKDWSITPNLDLKVQLEKATTNAPLIGEVDITGIISGIVERSLDGVKQTVQDEVKKALNLKPDVEKIWNQINIVHRLSTSPSVWLQITPRKAAFSQLDFKADSLGCGLALEVESHVFIQEKAPEHLKAPLPELQLADTLPGEFHLSIPVEISYATINQQLREELAKHPISIEGDVSVGITDATVHPYGDGVLLTLKFKGNKGYFKSASGTLHVIGIPVYDKDKAELRMEQLKYTAETNNILIKSVEWLAHSALLDKMKAAAVVRLDGEVKKVTEDANKQLANFKAALPKEIVADVSISDLAIERVVFAKDRAFAMVKANGKLSAQLHK